MAFKKPTLPKATEAEVFINKSSGTDYSALTLDELANEYESIDQQSQMLKGRILLEARERFPSDKEFGQWCATHSICVGSQQQRNRLINLARFFEGRELNKISISAAYEISAPANAEIAKDIYDYAKGKNLPVSEVKRQIAIRKGESLSIPVEAETVKTDDKIIEKAVEIMEESVKNETAKIEIETDLKAKIYADIGDTPPFDALRILKEISEEIRAKVYGK